MVPLVARLGLAGHPVAPLVHVLEHPEPRRSPQSGGSLQPSLRGIRPLPRPDRHALRVRHHGQVPTVGAAQPNDALRRAVGVERIPLGDRPVVVDVPHGHLRPGPHALVDGGRGEVAAPLAVGHPNSKLRAFHSLEPDRGSNGLFDPDRGESGLEAAAFVVDEARLLLHRQRVAALRPGHPTKQRHQLATIAHPQRERVRTVAEGHKLRLQLWAEEHRTRPSLG
mmetsp:Transcript_81309/g.248418  ORF Transcript_81309/g.248418 Transcript_81309/m.248418 type:complete len:224 (+) Transcript_81309:152-823(+)